MDRSAFERMARARILADPDTLLSDMGVASSATHHVAFGKQVRNEDGEVFRVLTTSNDNNPNSPFGDLTLREELLPRTPDGQRFIETAAGTILLGEKPVLQLSMGSLAIHA